MWKIPNVFNRVFNKISPFNPCKNTAPTKNSEEPLNPPHSNISTPPPTAQEEMFDSLKPEETILFLLLSQLRITSLLDHLRNNNPIETHQAKQLLQSVQMMWCGSTEEYQSTNLENAMKLDETRDMKENDIYCLKLIFNERIDSIFSSRDNSVKIYTKDFSKMIPKIQSYEISNRIYIFDQNLIDCYKGGLS
jgi:hypothetical protein